MDYEKNYTSKRQRKRTYRNEKKSKFVRNNYNVYDYRVPINESY